MRKFWLGIVLFFLGLLSPLWANQAGFHSEVQSLPTSTQWIIKNFYLQENCPAKLGDLILLNASYWGFDGTTHYGSLIVHKALAPDLTQILNEIYLQKFPLHQMESKFSLKGFIYNLFHRDNTEAFSGCRKQVNSLTKYSLHSQGRAIDINPIENPYQKGDLIVPSQGKAFLNRQQHFPGMIKPNDEIVKSFLKRGWRWGGHWKTRKDYMHFEK